MDEYSFVIHYLVSEGYVNNEKEATNIIEDLSESWIAEILEGWVPPFQKLPSGRTPMSRARSRVKDPDKLERVRTSATRFGADLNDPRDPDYDFSDNTIRSKKHPIEISYTNDGSNNYIQNTKTTGPVKDRVGAAREMQRMKDLVARKSKPGTKFLSQPIGAKRAALNQRTGMGPVNDQGVQMGISAHRSPKQKERKAPPMNPGKYKGAYSDPNYQ